MARRRGADIEQSSREGPLDHRGGLRVRNAIAERLPFLAMVLVLACCGNGAGAARAHTGSAGFAPRGVNGVGTVLVEKVPVLVAAFGGGGGGGRRWLGVGRVGTEFAGRHSGSSGHGSGDRGGVWHSIAMAAARRGDRQPAGGPGDFLIGGRVAAG